MAGPGATSLECCPGIIWLLLTTSHHPGCKKPKATVVGVRDVICPGWKSVRPHTIKLLWHVWASRPTACSPQESLKISNTGAIPPKMLKRVGNTIKSPLDAHASSCNDFQWAPWFYPRWGILPVTHLQKDPVKSRKEPCIKQNEVSSHTCVYRAPLARLLAHSHTPGPLLKVALRMLSVSIHINDSCNARMI